MFDDSEDDDGVCVWLAGQVMALGSHRRIRTLLCSPDALMQARLQLLCIHCVCVHCVCVSTVCEALSSR